MEKRLILICDDEAGVRDSLKLILDPQYDLVYATNGEEALEILKSGSSHPSLVIMDVKMPRMSGLDALKSMKKLKPELKVLIATGYESSDVTSQAINLGANDYVVKPFDRFEIRSKVAALLGLAPQQ